MADKRATKGTLVTTSWVTKEGHAFAKRNGRIQIIEGENLKYLCHEQPRPRRAHQPSPTSTLP
jgi:restriction system protein